MRELLEKTKNFCLYACAVCVLGGNTLNYFYFYKHLGDDELQWRFYGAAASAALFFFSLYMYANEQLKHDKARQIVSGWCASFLLVNFLGVLMGYHMHTVGFMLILAIILFSGLSHMAYFLYEKNKGR